MPCLLEACSSGVPKVVTTALDAIVKVRKLPHDSAIFSFAFSNVRLWSRQCALSSFRLS